MNGGILTPSNLVEMNELSRLDQSGNDCESRVFELTAQHPLERLRLE